MLMMWQWWRRRSISAAAMTSSPGATERTTPTRPRGVWRGSQPQSTHRNPAASGHQVRPRGGHAVIHPVEVRVSG
jgi:hypothetical protein